MSNLLFIGALVGMLLLIGAIASTIHYINRNAKE